MKNNSIELPIPTRDGQFIAHYSDKGLAGLDFPKMGQKPARTMIHDGVSADTISRWHRTTEAALKSALAGRAAKNLPPLDRSRGTEFQKKVWDALRNISLGETKSYGEIARAIGKPNAVRAVGSACGANPIPVLVPCHRVLAADKKLGGFSGGLNWKRTLLAREGVNL